MDFKQAIVDYITKKYGKECEVLEIISLGSGLVADGYKVVLKQKGEEDVKNIVCRKLHGIGMSRDYLADRIGYLTLQHEIANSHPNHTKSLDVVVYGKEIETVSISGVEDVFQMMEFASGISYVNHINSISNSTKLSDENKLIIKNIVTYLQKLHLIKPEGFTEEVIKNLYWRHSQDYIGGEVYLDVMDVWPEDKVFDAETKSMILYKLCLQREKFRNKFERTSKIHADFHPDNIRIKEDNSIEVLDATRAIWGEPADDVACLLSNYVYLSIVKTGKLEGSFAEAYDLLYREYLKLTNDSEVQKQIPLFMAVRLVILANPIFFSTSTEKVRTKLKSLIYELLDSEDFVFEDIYKLVDKS